MPESLTFATKPALARQILRRILDAGGPAKWVTGLDEYEVHSWIGWHRHITLSMHGSGGHPLASPQRRFKKDDTDLIPVTVPEVRQLITRLVFPAASHQPRRSPGPTDDESLEPAS